MAVFLLLCLYFAFFYDEPMADYPAYDERTR